MDDAFIARIVDAVADKVIEKIAGFGEDPMAAGGLGEDYDAGPPVGGDPMDSPPGEGEAVTEDLDTEDEPEDESVAEPEEKPKTEPYSSDATRETYAAAFAAEAKKIRDEYKREIDAERSRYSAKFESQQRTINALLQEREETYRRAVLGQCVSEGIDLDVDAELNRLSRYAAREEFDTEVEVIRERYKRTDALADDFLPVNGVHPYSVPAEPVRRQSKEEMLREIDAITRYGYSGDPSQADEFVAKYNASRKAAAV
jgi:hypothetical protein